MTKHGPSLPFIEFNGLNEGYWFCVDCARAAGEGKQAWLFVPRSKRPMRRCPDCGGTATALFEGWDRRLPIQCFLCRRCAVSSAARVRFRGRRLRCCFTCGSTDLEIIKASPRQVRIFRSRYRSAGNAFMKDFLRCVAAFPDIEEDYRLRVRLPERYGGLACYHEVNPAATKVVAFIRGQLRHRNPWARVLAGYVLQGRCFMDTREWKSLARGLDSILDGPERGAQWRRHLMSFVAPAFLDAARAWGNEYVKIVAPVLRRLLKGNARFIATLRSAKRADRPTLRGLKHDSKDLEAHLRRALRGKRSKDRHASETRA